MLRLRDGDFSFLESVEILDRFSLVLESPELVEVFENKKGITLLVRVNGVDVLTIERPKILEKVDYHGTEDSHKRKRDKDTRSNKL